MFATLAAVAALTFAQSTDTTVAVQSGTRLDVNDFGGSITIHTWGENRVRVHADHSSRDVISVTAGGSVVSVRSSGRRGPQSIDYDITVPAWMALNLSGTYVDISTDGTQGDITAETVQGDVKARGGNGYISLKSVEGTVTLEDAKGHIDLSTVNDDVTLSNVTGDITAETVDGGIDMTGIDAANVDANSVDGDIKYDGSVKEGGHYRLSTHDGDVSITLPEKAGATVSVSTFDGEFEACFPITLKNQSKHRFNFTVGSGSARIELESFDGDIKLLRPGAAACPRVNQDNDEDNDHDHDHP
ncbi:MAG TPA: DUF4097 family beta strand repeat-containing protein [Gemmatimonadales bacterium]|nr:DUF4097 family beta strand repeat-containing protein [Gemmatimonadales bacterium]